MSILLTRSTNYSYRMSYCISSWSTHCKTRSVFILLPYSFWPERRTWWIKILHYSSSWAFYSIYLFFLLKFMIERKLNNFPAIFFIIRKNYSSWITYICSNNFFITNCSDSGCRPTDLTVYLFDQGAMSFFN